MNLTKFTSPEEILWDVVDDKFSNMYDELMTCASYSVDRDLVEALLNSLCSYCLSLIYIERGSFSLNTDRKLPHDCPVYRKNIKLEEKILPIDVGIEEAFNRAGKSMVFQSEENQAKARVKACKGDQERNFLCSTRVVKLEHFVILLPIFITGFEYRGDIYEVVISGNKGVVEGRRPYGAGMLGKLVKDSWKKVRSVYNDTL